MGNCHRNNPFNCTQPRSETLSRCCTNTVKSSACPSITIREPDTVAVYSFNDEQVKEVQPVQAVQPVAQVQKVKVQKPEPTKAEIEEDRLKRHAALEQRRQKTKQQIETVKKLSVKFAALTSNTLKLFDSATAYKVPSNTRQKPIELELQKTAVPETEGLKPFEFPKAQAKGKEKIETEVKNSSEPQKLELPININKLRDYA